MGKRKDNGKWTLPGGGIDKGESPEDGARRELFEEAKIKAKEFSKLAEEKIICPDGKERVIHAFITFGDYPTDIDQDPDEEVDRWLWVDVSKGLPEDIAKNLHSPKNIVPKALGLQDF